MIRHIVFTNKTNNSLVHGRIYTLTTDTQDDTGRESYGISCDRRGLIMCGPYNYQVSDLLNECFITLPIDYTDEDLFEVSLKHGIILEGDPCY